MLTLSLTVAILMQTPSEIRLRLADKAAADKQGLATISFPGFDASDEGVKRSALHYCGTTAECSWSFSKARDRFIMMAVHDGRQKQALKVLVEASDGPNADWRVAEDLYTAKYHPMRPEALPSIGVTCWSHSTRRTIYTSCSTN